MSELLKLLKKESMLAIKMGESPSMISKIINLFALWIFINLLFLPLILIKMIQKWFRLVLMEIFLSGIYSHNNPWKCIFSNYHRKSAHSNGITQIIYKNLIIGNKPVNVIMSLGKDGFFKIWNA